MEGTWQDENLLRQNDEISAEGILSTLKKLINGEAAAAIQYKMAAQGILGPNQSYLVSHFSEHVDEEWKHYDDLVEALMVRNGMANMSLAEIIQNALPATQELTSMDSEFLRKFFIEAETNAVEAYTEFYKQIEDVDPDLADIVIGIISDEKAHKLDFERVE